MYSNIRPGQVDSQFSSLSSAPASSCSRGIYLHTFFTLSSTFWKIANHCNVLIYTTNQTIVPWTVMNVEPSINFEELLVQIKSGVFSTISASFEGLSSSILDSVYIWQDKSTDNSTVYSKNYTL